MASLPDPKQLGRHLILKVLESFLTSTPRSSLILLHEEHTGTLGPSMLVPLPEMPPRGLLDFSTSLGISVRAPFPRKPSLVTPESCAILEMGSGLSEARSSLVSKAESSSFTLEQGDM